MAELQNIIINGKHWRIDAIRENFRIVNHIEKRVELVLTVDVSLPIRYPDEKKKETSD